ncbi:Hypothetical protein PHPALM_6836 [Phytophthora palmivora]|uniref:Uncharacterized protein n=1 Tax=Phytophthora palmivora TaxID=4796 RepID=A0A2P4YDW5_9STRA|nr:Hypothetical protein PHPALM_6836 [Phytophthora palmivora]
MATSPSEPPPKHVKLRYRALAYVRRIGRRRQPNRPRAITRRSFVDTSGGCPPIRLSSADGGTNNVGYADSNGLRPVVRIISKRSFGDSGSARPAVRIGNRKSLIDPSGSKPVASLDARRSNLDSNDAVFTTGEIKVNKRTRRSRKKPRKTRDKGKNRHHRFLSLFHDHDGPQYLLFGGCCVKQEAFDPAETPGDLSSIGARAASFDSGFGFTCESPVSCPLPLGLAPTRTLPTMLNLRPRDGTGNGKFTLNSENGGFLSTGIKRKEPSPSSGYPSYTRTTPPSPFLNDFTLAGTLNNTRVRSRVSVGCNGWFLNDDDPVNSGWYRRCSSDEVKSNTSEVVLE